jgi:hypothetical protein
VVLRDQQFCFGTGQGRNQMGQICGDCGINIFFNDLHEILPRMEFDLNA